jgi:flavorubredoxin
MTLQFITAPMIHWPEVIMTYCAEEQVLFSADAFGKFGVYHADEDDWACEARRYYFNIVGKYGAQVTNVLKKVAALTADENKGRGLATIAPLHGPVLEGDKMNEALRLYTIWSAYDIETDGVLVAYASIHGNTRRAAEQLAQIIGQKAEDKNATGRRKACLLSDLCSSLRNTALLVPQLVQCVPVHFIHGIIIVRYLFRQPWVSAFPQPNLGLLRFLIHPSAAPPA